VKKSMARSVAAARVSDLLRIAVEGQEGRKALSRALREAAVALQPEPSP
jgi:hypothetical protein